MLQVTKRASNTARQDAASDTTSFAEIYDYLTRLVRRQAAVIILAVACALTIGLVYLLTTPASYTATASMVIDTRKVQLFQQQTSAGDVTTDAGSVLTQVEILKSENVGLSVIKNMHLTDDPEFAGGHGGLFSLLFGSLTGLFGVENAPSETQLQRQALGIYDAHRAIMRVGQTYVMDVSYSSHDPSKAARIANAIVDAYILDQLESKFQATRRASDWLQVRIKELKEQASSAQRAVVDFKQSHNMVDSGGQLMNEQELAELNSQLTQAHAAVAEAKAKLDNITEVMRQPIPDGAIAEALSSQVIMGLRNKYLEMAGRESLWSKRYGPNHLAVVNLRSQMLELRKNISDEMKKIAESFQSNYDIALARENAVRSRLDKTVSQSQTTDHDKVQLRELETNAQTYQALYDNFLQRYMEAVQQESFPITEARLISPASPPAGRSQPKSTVIIPASLIGGLALGFCIALFREMADRVFRTTSQVEAQLQVNCLAMLPAVYSSGQKPGPRHKFVKKVLSLLQPTDFSSVRAKGVPPQMPIGETMRPPFKSVVDRLPIMPSILLRREIPADIGLFRHIVDSPFSLFTEGLRSVKVAIDINGAVQTNRVIGVTSSIPNEGKSTIAANLAGIIAHAGSRVILVDSDLRNSTLSRYLSPQAELGFVDVIAKRCDLTSAIWKDPLTGLDFLPAGSAAKIVHAHDLLGSENTKKLFGQLREIYDYVIVDLAPLAPVVDTRSSTYFTDSYLYVIEWGRTKSDIVDHALSSAPEVYDRILGAVLSKADMDALNRYEHYRGNDYYRKNYSKYGYAAEG